MERVLRLLSQSANANSYIPPELDGLQSSWKNYKSARTRLDCADPHKH